MAKTAALSKKSTNHLVPEAQGFLSPDDVKSRKLLKSELNKELTEKENRFLGLWFSGEHLTRVKAMRAAGYDKGFDPFIEYLAKNILIRFETQLEDKKEIMRRLGAGEVEIIRLKLEIARNGKSELARNAALDSLAKWIGLSKDNVQGYQGDMVINIFKQEVTQRYELTQVNQVAVNSPPNNTDNTQKRYQLLPEAPKEAATAEDE